MAMKRWTGVVVKMNQWRERHHRVKANNDPEAQMITKKENPVVGEDFDKFENPVVVEDFDKFEGINSQDEGGKDSTAEIAETDSNMAYMEGIIEHDQADET